MKKKLLKFEERKDGCNILLYRIKQKVFLGCDKKMFGGDYYLCYIAYG